MTAAPHRLVLFDVPLSVIDRIESEQSIDFMSVALREQGSKATFMRMALRAAQLTLEGEAKELFRIDASMSAGELAKRFVQLDVVQFDDVVAVEAGDDADPLDDDDGGGSD